MNILMIANDDSFTYNLVHDLEMNQKDVKVIIKKPNQLSNDIIHDDNIVGVIVSSGASHPKDRQKVIEFLKQIFGEIPIFGIGLGHQILWYMTGGEVTHLSRPAHGETFKLSHDGQYIFKNIENNIDVTTYHSLICTGHNDHFKVVGTADGKIMAIRHKDYDIFGVEYHPDSVLSEYGDEQINNFLNIVMERNE